MIGREIVVTKPKSKIKNIDTVLLIRVKIIEREFKEKKSPRWGLIQLKIGICNTFICAT